ncbi:3-deoxy-D-manno-octulosonic acid kinase [Vibrio sp. S4M6]|uniref:3-deoxy-D-manno-octulosonic acid kinase n=1 Tax=Vibrio sinus TaxID=2946865 RepID=UPI00202A1D79|nr:3-deoxy-D-manno-octulosonic acid kinase [Vibrio sinus]MCL9780356.1 3-deoxy-D-manno-octulosonic acid kinase [Vibrio sinus]
MKELSTPKQMIWYDESLLAEDPVLSFDPDFWRSANKVIGSAKGRGVTWFVKTTNGEAALRHYRRGGLFGKLIKDTYWFSGWKKTRSYQEFLLLNHLNKAGVNVPRPVAARATRSLLGYRADILSEKVPNARDLVAILKETALPPETYNKIGQEIRKMHDAQVNHTDLNIHNILIDDREKVWIIDFDKCYSQNAEQWKRSNLDRLKRSFAKELNKRSVHWCEDDWQALLTGYRRS